MHNLRRLPGRRKVVGNKGGVDRLGVWVGLWRRGFKGRRLVVRGVPGQSLIELSPSGRFETAICFLFQVTLGRHLGNGTLGRHQTPLGRGEKGMVVAERKDFGNHCLKDFGKTALTCSYAGKAVMVRP